MVLFVEMKKEVNAIKEYLKQIEEEAMEMADRLKLDAQKRWGLEDKFKHAYVAIEKFLNPEEEPKPIIKAELEKPKTAKIDVRTGIKRVM